MQLFTAHVHDVHTVYVVFRETEVRKIENEQYRSLKYVCCVMKWVIGGSAMAADSGCNKDAMIMQYP